MWSRFWAKLWSRLPRLIWIVPEQQKDVPVRAWQKLQQTLTGLALNAPSNVRVTERELAWDGLASELRPSMRVVAVLLLLISVTDAWAQEYSSWVTSAKGKISFTQAGFYRWHDGGVSSLALSVGTTGKAERTGARWSQDHQTHLSYGLVKQNGLEVRKAEDVIHVHLAFSNSGRVFFGSLEPTIAVDIRSQFAPGYHYPKHDSIRHASRISDFLSPAIVVQTVGINWNPLAIISTKFGLAAKQTFVEDRMLRTRYNVELDRVVRRELGLSNLIEVEADLFANVYLDSELTLFASFNQPERPDLLWETNITMAVNRWLHVNLEYVAKLDRDVARSLQMKELVSLGVSFVLV